MSQPERLAIALQKLFGKNHFHHVIPAVPMSGLLLTILAHSE